MSLMLAMRLVLRGAVMMIARDCGKSRGREKADSSSSSALV